MEYSSSHPSITNIFSLSGLKGDVLYNGEKPSEAASNSGESASQQSVRMNNTVKLIGNHSGGSSIGYNSQH